jgi:hypothetical protein
MILLELQNVTVVVLDMILCWVHLKFIRNFVLQVLLHCGKNLIHPKLSNLHKMMSTFRVNGRLYALLVQSPFGVGVLMK